MPFDEGRLWKSDGSEALKQQLQRHFRNMTMAMDCVGCEKCKLWGKLQLLGEFFRLAPFQTSCIVVFNVTQICLRQVQRALRSAANETKRWKDMQMSMSESSSRVSYSPGGQ